MCFEGMQSIACVVEQSFVWLQKYLQVFHLDGLGNSRQAMQSCFYSFAMLDDTLVL